MPHFLHRLCRVIAPGRVAQVHQVSHCGHCQSPFIILGFSFAVPMVCRRYTSDASSISTHQPRNSRSDGELDGRGKRSDHMSCMSISSSYYFILQKVPRFSQSLCKGLYIASEAFQLLGAVLASPMVFDELRQYPRASFFRPGRKYGVRGFGQACRDARAHDPTQTGGGYYYYPKRVQANNVQ